MRDVADGLRSSPTGLGPDARWRRLRLDRGRPEPGRRHRGHDRASDALPRGDRAPQPDGQDPGNRCRRAGDRGDDAARPRDQRHSDLLAHPPRSRGRGLPPRARAARRLGRRPASYPLRRQLLRLPRRHRDRPPPRRGRRSAPTSRVGLASPTRSSPTSSTRGCFAGERWECAWRRAARPRSAASGRPLRSRTRAYATRSTSRS